VGPSESERPLSGVRSWLFAAAVAAATLGLAFAPILHRIPGVLLFAAALATTYCAGVLPGLTASLVVVATFGAVKHRSGVFPGNAIGIPALVIALALAWVTTIVVDGLHRRERHARRLAEEALARTAVSEERFRRIFDASQVGLIVIDLATRTIESVNPAFARIAGYPARELVGRNPTELMEGASPVIESGLLADLMSGRAASVRTQSVMRTKAGESVHVDIVALLAPNERGELRLVGTVADRTASVRAEHSQRMAAVGRLAGGIAHDFNNLLTVISGHALLLIGDGAPEWREDLRAIAAAAEKATDLTQQLLTFSRTQVLKPQIVDVNTVVGGLRRLLQSMLGKAVELTVELAPELGPVHVDPTRLEQVLMNLAVNARDAMPDGGRLHVQTEAAELRESSERVLGAPAGSYIALAVTDTGSGMDRGTLERIFDPFFTTKQVTQGTGLGLATVYGIVQQSGGDIAVDSMPGEGTTFRIYLPAASTQALAPA
jgi:two-component system cell cycle sensor histidine kinase/response regulator CckA